MANHDPNVERASKLDTTSLSDAIYRLGIAGQCLGIKPLDPRFRLTGRAFTIWYGPAGKPPATVGDYIDDVPGGSVVMLDNGARENAARVRCVRKRRTVWGDILTCVAHARGIAGTVIDGACRDTALARELETLAEARRQYGYHQTAKQAVTRLDDDQWQISDISV